MCMLTSCCYYKYRKYGNRNVVLFIIKQNNYVEEGYLKPSKGEVDKAWKKTKLGNDIAF